MGWAAPSTGILRRRRLAAPAAAAASLAIALAGCGSSSPSSSGPELAKFVPAGAGLYVAAVVRPEGTLAQDTKSAGQALTGGDPYGRLIAALETPGSPTLTYQADVAPWLGADGGVFLTSSGSGGSALLAELARGLLGSSGAHAAEYPFSTRGAQGAIVLATRDQSAAKSFLSSQASHAGAASAPYRGVWSETTPGGLSFALVDDVALIGSTAAVHEAIDTAKGAPSLHSTAQYARLASHAPAGALANVYRAGVTASETLPPHVSDLLDLLVGRPASSLSLVPGERSLSLYADATGSTEGLITGGAKAAETFARLPGESWFALGLGAGPPSLTRALSDLGGIAALFSGHAESSSLGVGSLLESLVTPLALLGRGPAAGSWEGPVGVFATGNGPLEIRAALTVDSTSAARSRAALAALAGELRARGEQVTATHVAGTEAALALHLKNLPVEVVVASGHGAEGMPKLVIGLGAGSVQLALAPPNTMSGAASAHDAQKSLGGLKPTLLIEVPELISILETIEATSEPTIAAIVPYLHRITTIAAGAGELSERVSRYRVLATLHS